MPPRPATVLPLLLPAAHALAAAEPFRDPNLPLDRRVDDLVAGDEVVQPFVARVNSAVERPIKELRGFERIALRPNEMRTVRLPLKGAGLTYWDAGKQPFVAGPGSVKIQVGGSSADVRLEKTVEVKE